MFGGKYGLHLSVEEVTLWMRLLVRGALEAVPLAAAFHGMIIINTQNWFSFNWFIYFLAADENQKRQRGTLDVSQLESVTFLLSSNLFEKKKRRLAS